MAVPERGRVRRASRAGRGSAGQDVQLEAQLTKSSGFAVGDLSVDLSTDSSVDLSIDLGQSTPATESTRGRATAKRVASVGVAATVAAGVAVAFALPAAAAPAVANTSTSTATSAASTATAAGTGRPKPAQPTNGDYAGLSAAAKAELEKTAKAQAAPDADPVEDVDARTANSTTTIDPGTGTRTTQVSPQALNFRDDAGEWQSVDNTLVPAGEKDGVPAGGGADTGWANSAAGYDATLPKDLTAPITVTDGSNAQQWVSLQLNPTTAPTSTTAAATPAAAATATDPAATATASAAAARTTKAAAVDSAVASGGEAPEVAPVAGAVEGSTVAYNDVLPGTDVALEAQGSGVKETITLDSPTSAALAAGALSYTVKTGPGLKLALASTSVGGDDDTVNVVNAKGATVFTLPAPFMDDAKGAHSEDIDVTLTPGATAGETTLTVTPSASWLGAPERAWPVVIDPTISYPSSILGCGITSSIPTSSSCTGGEIPLIWNTTNGWQTRGLLKFPTLFDVIPADAQIAQAKLIVNTVQVAGETTTTTVDVKELSQPFTAQASWNTRNGSTAWTTAGGDRGSAVARDSVTPATDTSMSFDVADTVQRWLEGSTVYNGFELEKTASAPGGAPVRLTQANDASLFIEWDPRAGDRKGNSAVVTESLDDSTSVAVNPATGNAMVTTKQLNIAGVGLDLNVAHTSNSVGTAQLGVNGSRWTDSLSGVHLQPYAGSMFYTDGSGANWTFYRALDDSWIRPAGLDADLVQNGDGTFTLTGRQSKVAQKFRNIGTSSAPSYGLSSVTDRNGNTITFTYDASARLSYNNDLILRKVTDTRGRDLNITNFGYWNSWITDVTNREPSTTITNNQLASETNAAGGTTSYEYDSADRVTSITVPEGERTELTYDGSGRVLTLKRIANSGQDPTWTFAYTTFDRTSGTPATKTTVTDPNGHNSVYTSDGRGRVADAVDARGKKRSSTYTANDETATSTGSTAGSAGGSAAQTSTNTYDAGTSGTSAAAATWNLTASRLPTGAGIGNTFGTGARLYDVMTSTDARGTVTTNAYDTAGNQTTSTTGGVTTKTLYQGNIDPDYGGTVNCGPTVNNVVTATKAGVVCETRDGAYVKGSTAAATTAHRVAYRYDAKGQLTTMLPGTPSAQQQQIFIYDDLSRLSQTTDGRGQTTFYGYDSMDRLTYTLYQDGRVVSHYFGDETGNGWLRAVDEYPANSNTADRHTDYSRDDLGRLRATVMPEDTTNLDYDKLGNLTQYTDAGGAVKYAYNDANQLISLALPGGSCTGQTLTSPGAASTKCVLFGVDDDGRRTSTRYPGGQTMAATLDDSGRLKQVIGTTLTGSTPTARVYLSYGYTDAAAPTSSTNPNKDSQIVSSVADAIAGTNTTYTHDGLDRLTSASTYLSSTGGMSRYEGFCYDGAGNRTKYLNATSSTCSTGTPAATFTYNGGSELTAATGVTPTGASLAGTGFSYDGNGNQTSAKSQVGLTTAYSAQEAVSSFTPAGTSAIAQSYASGNGGNNERTKSGSTGFAVSPLSPAPAWAKTGTTSTWTVRDPGGTLIAVRIGSSASSATEYYPFTDNVASVRAMIKADGTLTNTYSYSAYGSTLTASEATGASQPYRYGGGYTDTATGLIKLGARYYDPAQGRFTQADPSGQEANNYLYAQGNPVQNVDPEGLESYDQAKERATAKAYLAAALGQGRHIMKGKIMDDPRYSPSRGWKKMEAVIKTDYGKFTFHWFTNDFIGYAGEVQQFKLKDAPPRPEGRRGAGGRY